MPCESCAVQFSVFRRRRACPECERWYCGACLRRGGGSMCAACRALSTRPLARSNIAHLKVRDLQAFLQRQNVSTRGCVEKEELLALCLCHVNSAAYRRRAGRAGAAPHTPPHPPPPLFTSLKGFTSNINEFINHAFDIRTPAHPAPAPPPPPAAAAPAPQPATDRGSCCNSTHQHAPPAPPRPPHARSPDGEGETLGAGEDEVSSPGCSPVSARVDTADCFEVEDLADSGWEFITRPADPLPNDSEVLLTVEEGSSRVRGVREAAGAARLPPPPATPPRASSELDLRRRTPPAQRAPPARRDRADSASLDDEPALTHTEGRVSLQQLGSRADLDALSVRQLKELLSANRVEYRGCVERAELVERAGALYAEHARYRGRADSLPLDECCKICMAAPLECVLLECGHMAACTACGKRLAECPICRRYVTRAVRFFRS